MFYDLTSDPHEDKNMSECRSWQPNFKPIRSLL